MFAQVVKARYAWWGGFLELSEHGGAVVDGGHLIAEVCQGDG